MAFESQMMALVFIHDCIHPLSFRSFVPSLYLSYIMSTGKAKYDVMHLVWFHALLE